MDTLTSKYSILWVLASLLVLTPLLLMRPLPAQAQQENCTYFWAEVPVYDEEGNIIEYEWQQILQCDDPIGEVPSDEEPMDDMPSDEEQTDDVPPNEEPTDDAPPDEEPTDDVPPNEEPVDDGIPYEEPNFDELAIDVPLDEEESGNATAYSDHSTGLQLEVIQQYQADVYNGNRIIAYRTNFTLYITRGLGRRAWYVGIVWECKAGGCSWTDIQILAEGGDPYPPGPPEP